MRVWISGSNCEGVKWGQAYVPAGRGKVLNWGFGLGPTAALGRPYVGAEQALGGVFGPLCSAQSWGWRAGAAVLWPLCSAEAGAGVLGPVCWGRWAQTAHSSLGPSPSARLGPAEPEGAQSTWAWVRGSQSPVH